MDNNTEPDGIEITSPRAPGRPRSRARDRAILESALALMQRDGYARMTMDAVAAAAGTTKSSLYRRYPGKAEMASAAIAFLREQRPVPATDDARSDLIEELRGFRQGLERPHGMAMIGTVLAEEDHVPELAAAFRRDVAVPRRERLHGILRRLSLRGGVDVRTAADMLVGSLYAAHLARGRVPRDWPESVVAALVELPSNP